MQIKEVGLAVMVNLSETWLRNHQVLPQEYNHSINQPLKMLFYNYSNPKLIILIKKLVTPYIIYK